MNSSSPRGSSQLESTEQGPAIPRWILKAYTRLNVWVYRCSGGRLMSRLAGDPICLVTMTGARSGKRRTLPLMYVPYQEGVLLVASQGGAPHNPVWYKNLIKHPEIVVEVNGKQRKLHAELLQEEARGVAWKVAVEHYAPYAEYQQRTLREIPVFYCRPE